MIPKEFDVDRLTIKIQRDGIPQVFVLTRRDWSSDRETGKLIKDKFPIEKSTATIRIIKFLQQ